LEHGVAEELEALVALRARALGQDGRVRKRQLQQRRIAERVAEAGDEFFAGGVHELALA
jgi:hypothetical protein